jgi:predicted permease
LRTVAAATAYNGLQPFVSPGCDPESIGGEVEGMALFMDQFRQALRRLARAPLFTTITLITLAVGIGANTVVFSVVEGVLLKPLAYPHPEKLIGVWHKAPGIDIGNQDLNISPSLYFIDREQSSTLEDIGMYQGDSVSVTGSGQPEHVEGLDVTDGTLSILGVKPEAGRLFSHRDDLPSAPKTVVLSYAYWQKKFGGDRSVIGRPITIDGTAREIIGVLPRNFRFLDRDDDSVYLPMQLDRGKVHLGQFSYEAVARLKPGATLEQAGADLNRLIPITNRTFPPPDGFSLSLFEKAQIRVSLHTLKQDVVGDVGNVLWVLMGSIGIVLLVACANVANLLLVRVEGRRQELAIRSALGAGRGRIIADLLLESLVLGLAGSAIGLALAFGALRVLQGLKPTGLPRLNEIGIDLPVLAFALGAGLFVSLVIGSIPVLKLAGANLQSGLREGGRALSQGRERHRARKALVVVQVALALVLLICSGLMIRTFLALVNVNPGFNSPETLQKFNILIPESMIPEGQGERVIRMEQAILDKLGSIPGVSSVSFGNAVPMDGNGWMDPVYSQDHVYKEGEMPPLRRFNFVAPQFFTTLGIRLVAGRDFTWNETYSRRPVAIVAEKTAKDNWGSAANALGKQVRVGLTDDWREVVGVAADVHYDGVDKPTPASVYWPVLETNFEGNKESVRRWVTFAIRTSRAGSAEFMGEAQRAVWSVNGDLPIAYPDTIGELYKKSMARTSFTLIMLCVAGGMALLLGIVGIYGVISYAVTQRTREIGIRMAMGAQRSELTGLFVRQGLMLAAIGAGIGIGTSFVCMRLMSSLLFNVSPMDPWTYAAATGAVVAIAWVACYLPSRRAAAVNPVVALRAE